VRCLRTRRHLSVALLTARAADAGRRAGLALGPDALRSIAEDLARHIRCYDLVAVSGAAEVMRTFSEATCERTSVILDRLRAATATLPRVPPGGSSPLWGLRPGPQMVTIQRPYSRRLGTASRRPTLRPFASQARRTDSAKR
jgi:hypothetical protein